MAALVLALAVGTVRYAIGQAHALAYFTNLVWVCFDLAVFSVIIQAVRYRGFQEIPDDPQDNPQKAAR